MKKWIGAAVAVLLAGVLGFTALAHTPSYPQGEGNVAAESSRFCREDHPCGRRDCQICCEQQPEEWDGHCNQEREAHSGFCGRHHGRQGRGGHFCR